MLSVDISQFMSAWLQSWFHFVQQFFNILQNTIVFQFPSGTFISAFDIAIAITILNIIFGLFIFVAPRFKKGV